MKLDFRQAVPEDSEWLFDTYRRTMEGFVTSAYGWDDDVQQAGFAKSLPQGSCQIVTWEGNRYGFVHWEVEPDLVWLRMLCIVPEMQKKSIGRAAISKMMSLSCYLQKPLYLHVFVSGLLEDVLINPFNQWAASLNIGNLATNLPVVGASACWVFLDACQELVDSVLSEYDGLDGVVLVKAKFGKIASTRVRSLALAGSRFGQLAWGPDSRDPPYFTQALLRSFEACVDRDSNGAWVVTGERLLCNVPKVADAAFGYSSLDVEALTKFANQATLVTVPNARIPVVVRTDNLADMAYLTLIEASDGLTFIQSAPLQTNCFLEVAPTGTEFEARPTFSGAQAYRPAKFHANPCAQIVRLLP